jgi:hypothetical protein
MMKPEATNLGLLPNKDTYAAIKKRIDTDYNLCNAEWSQQYSEASIDTRLEAGDPSLNRELSFSQMTFNRNDYVFNRVRPLLNMVSGQERKTRKTIICVPGANADQVTADQFSKIIMTTFKKDQVYETLSEAFHQGACITGLNLLHVYLDFRYDPISGDLRVENLPFNTFYIDPFFKKPDLSDCAFVWRRSYLTHSAVVALMPDKEQEILDLPVGANSGNTKLRFSYMPETYGITQKSRLAYDEYYYRDYRKQTLLVDKDTGETLDVSHKKEVDVQAFLAANPGVTVIEQNIPTVRLAIMVQDVVLHDSPQPLGIDRFPFIAVTGYYNSMMPNFYNRIQGIARSLRSPQLLLNRRIMLSTILLESQANSGWIYKEGAVLDVKHLFNTGEGRIIPISENFQITDIQPIQPPQIPPSFFQLQETFGSELNSVSGISETMMGTNENPSVAGVLESLRQRAGLVTLEPIFDRFNQAKILLGEIFVEAIQRNYTPGKISTILGGEKPAPLFYNKAFGKYHCQIENGFDTDTQKQLEFAQLIQLMELGVKIPPKTIISAATLQNKTELIQDIEQAEQQQSQMLQQQAQAEVQEAQARIQLAQARAQSDIGLKNERDSRVLSNIGLMEERESQKHKDDTEALLSFIKALKEIEGMDYAHLTELLTMQKIMKETQEPDVTPATASKPVKKPVKKVAK